MAADVPNGQRVHKKLLRGRPLDTRRRENSDRKKHRRHRTHHGDPQGCQLLPAARQVQPREIQ